MQFLKKHITELCFMLLLCGTLWGAVQLIVSGHIFNGDFALYIRQAQSIQYGDMQQVFSDMQEMITHSTYQRYSPILYPWGYPLLLFPCVALFGINYFAFKIVGVICLVGAFIFLYYHPILSKERFRMSVLLVLALLTGNIFYWGYVNSVSSELPFFCFLMFSFWTMNKLYALKEQTEKRTILYIGLGILLFFHGTDSYGRILLIYFLNRTSMEKQIIRMEIFPSLCICSMHLVCLYSCFSFGIYRTF